MCAYVGVWVRKITYLNFWIFPLSYSYKVFNLQHTTIYLALSETPQVIKNNPRIKALSQGPNLRSIYLIYLLSKIIDLARNWLSRVVDIDANWCFSPLQLCSQGFGPWSKKWFTSELLLHFSASIIRTTKNCLQIDCKVFNDKVKLTTCHWLVWWQRI